AQNDGRQRGAQDLRVGEGRSRLEIRFIVEPDAHPRPDPPATPRALVGGRLADGLDAQLLDLVAPGIALDAGQTAVHDISDSGNRERGFRHIRGQDDAPQIALGTEDAFLLSLRQTRIEWEHLRAGCAVLAQGFGSLADLAFAGQEDQDIAWAVA